MADLITKTIEEFFKEYQTSIVHNEDNKGITAHKIYNEFSLQHELGTYLRLKLNKEKIESKIKQNAQITDIFENLNYRIYFEKNVNNLSNEKFDNWVKKEIDIVIENESTNEKYAIELKFPLNGQYPETMFQFTKDLQFMEQVKSQLKFTKTYCLALVNDEKYYSTFKNSSSNAIYKYFRAKNNPLPPLSHEIKAPVAKGGKSAEERVPTKLNGEYQIDWKPLNNGSIKYYTITVN